MSFVALLAGVGTFAAVVTVAVLLRRLPAGRFCPECGGGTVSVRPGFWARLVRPRIQVRWCSTCGWSGLRRRRPPVAPSEEPPAHESGFQWARPDPSEAPLFRWRPKGSGDRGVGGPDTRSDPEARGPERERGERGRSGESGGPDPVHPSGFRWKDEPDPDAPVFLWGEDEEADGDARG